MYCMSVWPLGMLTVYLVNHNNDDDRSSTPQFKKKKDFTILWFSEIDPVSIICDVLHK